MLIININVRYCTVDENQEQNSPAFTEQYAIATELTLPKAISRLRSCLLQVWATREQYQYLDHCIVSVSPVEHLTPAEIKLAGLNCL